MPGRLWCTSTLISQVPLLCSAIHRVIETHKEEGNEPEQRGSCPWASWTAVCELREFCWGEIKDRNTSLGATALWQAVTLEGRCLCCYTSRSSVQNPQLQWALQSRDWFSLLFSPSFLELTDFRLLNSKAAKDASCLTPATSISQALLQQQGRNKISYYFFIWTAEKDNHTSRILSCLHQHSFAHFLCLRLKEQHGRTDTGPSVRIWLLDRWKASASPSEPLCSQALPIPWLFCSLSLDQTHPFWKNCIHPFVANNHIFISSVQDAAVFSHFPWEHHSQRELQCQIPEIDPSFSSYTNDDSNFHLLKAGSCGILQNHGK